MFDTVNFGINRLSNPECNPLIVLPYLTDITEMCNGKVGLMYIGRVLDYKVVASSFSISFKGSLCKSCFGNNLQTLTRQKTEETVKRISDILHLEISSAKLQRLDISSVVATQNAPALYLPFLGEKPYFTRTQCTPDSLYYNNHKRQLSFYDKTKEAKAKKMPIPEELRGHNLLRYEYRINKNLRKQFNRDVEVRDLYSDPFFHLCIQQWHNEFMVIQKISKRSILGCDIKTPKDAKKVLFADLLRASGPETVGHFIAQLKAQNSFLDSKYYSRLKRELNKLYSQVGEEDDCVRELERKIHYIAKYAE
ncbi:MAG: phage/plasmid replication protein [Bacteroidales bacterium]